ncbi:MAG TPA: thymidine phosphorylase [Thermoanaerobaculia bacterium]|nr:thymidine phosphorylase [Thermoanaerobaculia bacterium]
MLPYRILARKRDGESLTQEEIQAVVAGATDGSWSDAQIAAFLMAAVLRGLDGEETRTLTRAMLESGERWALGREVPHLCDKHSTGGVGDKASLVLAPLLAACGLPIVMLTGRGLGHTGGTADKLETIPGLRLDLDRDDCLALLRNVGIAIGVATASIAPADRRLYAIRDQTATVEALPLITASILSKKIATGAAALVLDVKTGDGAFLTARDEATALARMLVDTAAALGCRTSALVTDMSQPLGRTVGHAVEVEEALACLAGEGPEDLEALAIALCREVASLCGEDFAAQRLRALLRSGQAREVFLRWARAQGAEREWAAAPRCGRAPHEVVLTAAGDGWLQRVACRQLGLLMLEAGAGRRRQGEAIDPGVGLAVRARLGQRLEAGEELARIWLRRPDAGLAERVRQCFALGEEPVAPPPLVHERIS